jgi:hypothetical protein
MLSESKRAKQTPAQIGFTIGWKAIQRMSALAEYQIPRPSRLLKGCRLECASGGIGMAGSESAVFLSADDNE